MDIKKIAELLSGLSEAGQQLYEEGGAHCDHDLLLPFADYDVAVGSRVVKMNGEEIQEVQRILDLFR